MFLHVDWNFRAVVRPRDEITAEAEVLDVRTDKTDLHAAYDDYELTRHGRIGRHCDCLSRAFLANQIDCLLAVWCRRHHARLVERPQLDPAAMDATESSIVWWGQVAAMPTAAFGTPSAVAIESRPPSGRVRSMVIEWDPALSV